MVVLIVTGNVGVWEDRQVGGTTPPGFLKRSNMRLPTIVHIR